MTRKAGTSPPVTLSKADKDYPLPMSEKSKLRFMKLALRDGGLKCRFCGIGLTLDSRIWPTWTEQRKRIRQLYHPTIDHWIPKKRGGKTTCMTNQVLACPPCNTEKGILTGEEYIAVLVFRSEHPELAPEGEDWTIWQSWFEDRNQKGWSWPPTPGPTTHT